MSTLIDIELRRGDTWTIKFGPIREDGELVSLTGASAWFTVKNDPDDADDDALIQVTEEVDEVNGYITLNETTGIATVLVKPAITRIAAKGYAVDFQIKYSGDKIGTPASGTLRVTKDVGHATS